MGKIITAIDIGTTKIIAIAGERDENGNVRILTKGSVPTPQKSVKRGVVQNIAIVSNAIKRAIEIAENNSDIEFSFAFIGIAGQHIKSIHNNHSMFISSPENIITQEDVDKMTREIRGMSLEATEEIIDVIPQTYTVDKEVDVDEPVGRWGKKLSGNFHIIIGDTAGTTNIKRCVNHAGIEVNDLFLEPIASSEAVLTQDEKDGGVALVDIGGGTTDLAIFYEGILRHTVVIPFGGNVVTDDIKKAYNILPKYAEKLKIECGTALRDFAEKGTLAVIPGINGRPAKEIAVEELASVIQARMEEIIDIVNFEITNLGFHDKLAAGIALTGGGSLLKHLPQLMKFRTGLDVKLSQPMSSVFPNADKENGPKLSTAVGLIMLGLKNLDKVKETKTKRFKNKKVSFEKGTGMFNGFLNSMNKTIKQKTFDFFEDNDTEI